MSAISSDAYLSAISGFAIHALNHSDFQADEIVLDGSVRRLDADFIELDDLIYRDNWNGIDGRFSLSMLVTGRLADDGVIVEGTFVIEGVLWSYSGLKPVCAINSSNVSLFTFPTMYVSKECLKLYCVLPCRSMPK